MSGIDEAPPQDTSPAQATTVTPSPAGSGSGGGPAATAPPPAPADLPSSSRRRERARTRSRSIARAVAAVVVIVALGVGAYIGLSAAGRARSAQSRFDAAVGLLERAEKDLKTVDETIRAEITSDLATRAVEAIPFAAKVRADAIAAIDLIDRARPDLPAESLALADALKASAEARAEMMAEAPAILEADAKAARALAPADQAVAEIKAAEELTAKAVAEFNKHTAAGVRQSTALSNQAETRLREARSLLATATAAFPEADFTPFTAYVDAKIGLIAESRSIDSLWLAGKIEESNRRLEAYNRRDAEIVAMAKALPASIRDPIVAAYEAATKQATERYFAARERARAADQRVSQLREAKGVKD